MGIGRYFCCCISYVKGFTDSLRKKFQDVLPTPQKLKADINTEFCVNVLLEDPDETSVSPLGFCLKRWHHVFIGPAGSRSSQSDFSDDQEGKGGTQQESSNQEANAQHKMADCLSDGSAQEPPTSFSGSHGDKDMPTPSRGQHRDFSSIQPEISRQSFRLAMGNPSDLFVDVMWSGDDDVISWQVTWRHD